MGVLRMVSYAKPSDPSDILIAHLMETFFQYSEDTDWLFSLSDEAYVMKLVMQYWIGTMNYS